MIAIPPFTIGTEAQRTFLAAFGVGRQATIACVLLTNISNAKSAIHATGLSTDLPGENTPSLAPPGKRFFCTIQPVFNTKPPHPDTCT